MSSRNVVDLRKRKMNRSAPAHPGRVNIADASSRTSPLRVKRRRSRLIMSAGCLVLAIAGVFGASYASYLPHYTVHTFTVEGAQKVPAALVSRYIDTQLYTGARPFFSPNNVLSFNTDVLGDTIVGFFPRIRSAKISRTSMLATAIAVSIQERQEFALWCSNPENLGFVNPNLDLRNPNFPDAGCYDMDESGFIFAQTDTDTFATSTRKYVFGGGLAASSNPIGHSFAPGHLPGILAFFQQLQQINLAPEGAVVDDNGADFVVPLTEGFAIKASFGQDVASLTRNLQLILGADVLQGKQSDIQYIDLRFGDRAYYKLKGAATASQQETTTADY